MDFKGTETEPAVVPPESPGLGDGTSSLSPQGQASELILWAGDFYLDEVLVL